MVLKRFNIREVNMQKKLSNRIVGGTVFFVVLCVLFFCGKSQANTTGKETKEAVSSTDSCSTEDITKFTIQGNDLTAEEVNTLEGQLVHEPNDLVSRAKLLGFYSFARINSEQAKNSYQRHALWIIENKPETEIASGGFTSFNPIIDGEAFFQARKLWLQQVDKNPDNAAIIGNAATFFLIHDSNKAEQLFKKAQSLEPKNPKWSQALAHLYELSSFNRTPSEQSVNAQKALEEMEKSLALVPSEIQKFYMLDDLAKFAYEAGYLNKAESYAKEILLLAPKYPKDWNYGNAIHHSNIILGRIALTKGDIEAAKNHLIEAGKTPGSPQLNSFGPNMTLAKELLDKNEIQVVLSYFELCGKFWKNGEKKLQEWSALIKGGQTPDFGANLKY